MYKKSKYGRIRARVKKKVDYNSLYYDIVDDWDVIEASLWQQYNVRIRDEYTTMQWNTFIMLLSNLTSDTPLGKLVIIRSEKDKKVIKNYTKDQLRIYREWKNKVSRKILENGSVNQTQELMGIFKNICK